MCALLTVMRATYYACIRSVVGDAGVSGLFVVGSAAHFAIKTPENVTRLMARESSG